MRKVFLESLGYNAIGFIFDDGLIIFDCETIEEAKEMDCSGIEDCETAEEAATNCNTKVYPFNESEWENITEIDERTVSVNLSMNIEIEASAADSLKSLEHHIENLIDLDNWPEIKSVYGVEVTELE